MPGTHSKKTVKCGRSLPSQALCTWHAHSPMDFSTFSLLDFRGCHKSISPPSRWKIRLHVLIPLATAQRLTSGNLFVPTVRDTPRAQRSPTLTDRPATVTCPSPYADVQTSTSYIIYITWLKISAPVDFISTCSTCKNLFCFYSCWRLGFFFFSSKAQCSHLIHHNGTIVC